MYEVSITVVFLLPVLVLISAFVDDHLSLWNELQHIRLYMKEYMDVHTPVIGDSHMK